MGHLFNLDNWKFEKKKAAHDLVAVTAVIDKYKIETNSGNRTATIKVQDVYADGTSQDVTAEAEVTAAKSGVVKINKDVITATATGSTDITATFGGKISEAQTSDGSFGVIHMDGKPARKK